MGLFKRFRKEEVKQAERKIEPSWVEKTYLQADLNDGQTYEELYKVAKQFLFLNPEKINLSYTDARNKAIESEKKNDIRTKQNWAIAIGLAIYYGNQMGAKESIDQYNKLAKDKELELGKKTLEYFDQLFWIQENGYGFHFGDKATSSY